jgi:hypothetical protein
MIRSILPIAIAFAYAPIRLRKATKFRAQESAGTRQLSGF